MFLEKYFHLRGASSYEIVIKCMGRIKFIYDEADRAMLRIQRPKKIAITKNNLPSIKKI